MIFLSFLNIRFWHSVGYLFYILILGLLLFASFSGVVVHSVLGPPDFLHAGLLAIGSFFGGLVGARLSLDVKERYLQILVSSVILIAAVKLFVDSLSGHSEFLGF